MVRILPSREHGQQVDGLAVPAPLGVISAAILGSVIIITVIVAALVLFSLIPVFVPTSDLDVNFEYSFSINAIYRSNLINGTLLSIGTDDLLKTSLNNALRLHGIDKLNAQFMPSVTCNGISPLLYNISKYNVGDLLNINFTTNYPKNCFLSKCHRQFINQTKISISTTYANLSVLMNLNNSRSTIYLSFCSFNDSSVCQTNVGSCEATCDSSDTDDDETCSDDDEDEEEEDEDECSLDVYDEDVCQAEDEDSCLNYATCQT